jgi:hypothetical protein
LGWEGSHISDLNEAKVNRAIQDCLKTCRGSREPVTQVAAFLAGSAAKGLNGPEKRTVEMAVHQILHAIADSHNIAFPR